MEIEKLIKEEKEFIEVTKRWYDFVSQDHHKDRDCHWYLEKTTKYSYGQAGTDDGWRICHSGYIFDDFEVYGETKEEVMKEAIKLIDEKISPPLQNN